MWEFLKTKARKERDLLEIERIKSETLRKEREEVRLTELRKIESQRLHAKMKAENDKLVKADRKKVDKFNSICPKCGSIKVVDKISQLKGEINGSSSGYYGYSHGSIHGSMDTLEVNKCNDCTNEWKKTTYNKYGSVDMEHKMRYLKVAIQNILAVKGNNESFMIKESREFWSGTKLEILPLLIETEYLGFMGNDYVRVEMRNIIKGQDEILVNNLGFVR